MQNLESLSFEPNRLKLRVAEWLDSGGREQLTLALERAKQTRRRIAEALKPDIETLRQPMTI